MPLPTTPPPSEWIDGYGYEYETAKDLLLRNKAETQRNITLGYQYILEKPRGYIQAWVEGYDSSKTGNHATRRRNAELAASSWLHEGPGRSGSERGDSPADAGPSPDDAVRAAVQPEIPARMGA